LVRTDDAPSEILWLLALSRDDNYSDVDASTLRRYPSNVMRTREN
jgi:hypothetical protein